MKLTNVSRKIALVTLDLAIMFICGLASSYLVTGRVHNLDINVFVLCSIVGICVLIGFKFYSIRLASSSVEVVLRAGTSLMLSAVICLITVGYVKGFLSASFRWVFVFYITSLLIILASRLVYRLIITMGRGNFHCPSAIVYGAGEIGSTMARLSLKGKFDYNILGFVDDNESLKGELIVNKPVLGTEADLASVIKDSEAENLIIAITKLSAEKIQHAVETASSLGCKVKIVPSLFETKGRADVSVRDIDYADLLGRPLDHVDPKPLIEMFSAKRILVTGAGGSIGSEICRQLVKYNPSQLVLLDIDETELHDLALRLLDYEREWSETIVPVVCDIRNASKVDRIIARYKPEIVFHAAAYKHVPLMELYPEEAIINNICGSYNVFNSCKNNGVARVVVISTDKAVNPTNVMGATKRVVELLASSFYCESTEFCCVRFGNVIGSRGSMLPLFLEEIKAGKPITVTDKNIIRYFMAIPEAVSLVFRAATIANGGEVMVLDMGKPVKIYDFAQKLISIYGDGRSSIRVTGLRPGEKLYEELLADKDNTIPTESEKIFKAKVVHDQRFTSSFVSSMVSELPNKSPVELVTLLHELVPEFGKH